MFSKNINFKAFNYKPVNKKLKKHFSEILSKNNEILKSSKKISSLDSIHKWLFLESRELIFNINYWYSFFHFFNISVHNEQTENGQEVIVKQIALCKLNAITFSSQRSYLDNIIGRFYAYYPSDVFFFMG